jgi:hypothetical protein
MACALVPAAARAGSGRWLGSAEVGFDSYMERYSISDADTLSSINEARARVRFGYAVGSLGRNYVLLQAAQLIGQSSYETAGRGLVTRRFGVTGAVTANLDGEIARRGFRQGAVYEFPNNYTRATARAGLRARTAPWLTLRLDDRIERIDYDQRTEFDYDYTRNSATGAVDLSRDPLRSLTVGTRLTTMSIPDSSEIEYHAFVPFVEARTYGAPHRRAYASVAAERRLYPDNGTRSSFWSVLFSGLIEMPIHRSWSIEAASDFEDYAYDVSTEAYPDHFEIRNYLTANWIAGGLRLGAGPAFGWLSSGDSPQDEYREAGVRFSLEEVGPRGLFVSASYEPGSRDYTAYNDTGGVADNADAIFSDYRYHRVSLFANVRVTGPFWFNVFLDYQPEDHHRTGDDATATIGSASLTYSF